MRLRTKHWWYLVLFFAYVAVSICSDPWGIIEAQILEIGDVWKGKTSTDGERSFYRIPPRQTAEVGSLVLNLTLVTRHPDAYLQIEFENSIHFSKNTRQVVRLSHTSIRDVEEVGNHSNYHSPYFLKTILPLARSSTMIHISGPPGVEYVLEVHHIDNSIQLNQPVFARASVAAPLFVYLTLPSVLSRFPGQNLEIVVESETKQLAVVRAQFGDCDSFHHSADDAVILSDTAVSQTMSTLGVIRFLLEDLPNFGSGIYVIQIKPRDNDEDDFASKPFILTARITSPMGPLVFPMLVPVCLFIFFIVIFTLFTLGFKTTNWTAIYSPLFLPLPLRQAYSTKDRVVKYRTNIYLRNLRTVATSLLKSIPLSRHVYFFLHFPRDSGDVDDRYYIYRHANLASLGVILCIFYVYMLSSVLVVYRGLVAHLRGNQDSCSFNYLCGTPYKYFVAFNSVLSNIPMIIAGFACCYITFYRESQYHLHRRQLEQAVMDNTLPISTVGHFRCIHSNDKRDVTQELPKELMDNIPEEKEKVEKIPPPSESDVRHSFWDACRRFVNCLSCRMICNREPGIIDECDRSANDGGVQGGARVGEVGAVQGDGESSRNSIPTDVSPDGKKNPNDPAKPTKTQRKSHVGKLHWSRLKMNQEDMEISTRFQDVRFAFYYLGGISMICQGTLSAIYHLCPRAEYFQFDSTLMYSMMFSFTSVIYFRHKNRHNARHLCPSKAYHVDGKTKKFEMVYFLAGSAVFCIFVAFTENSFWNFLFVFLSSMAVVYLLFRILREMWKGYQPPESQIELNKQWKKGLEELLKDECGNGLLEAFGWLKYGIHSICIYVYHNKAKSVFGGIFTMFSLYITVCAYIRHMSIAPYLLAILGSQIFCYYIFHMIDNKSSNTAYIFCICTVLVGAVAGYGFVLPTTDKTLQPWLSRELNHPCVLFSFFDTHDLWHFFSTLSCFFGFASMIKLDENELVHRCVHCEQYRKKKNWAVDFTALTNWGGLECDERRSSNLAVEQFAAAATYGH